MANVLGKFTGLLALTAIVSAGCASVTINKVMSDPGRYRTERVNLSGSVTDSYSVLGRGVYQLEDRTGRMWVVSDSGVPHKGARVTVKGTVREGYDFGSFGDRIRLPSALGSGVVLIEESHKAK